MPSKQELLEENDALWGYLEQLAEMDDLPPEAEALLDQILPDDGQGDEDQGSGG
ncbi:MAG: hypothetical protein ACHQ7N_13505 [Candidatus Methylomirabilales bacterium]